MASTAHTALLSEVEAERLAGGGLAASTGSTHSNHSNYHHHRAGRVQRQHSKDSDISTRSGLSHVPLGGGLYSDSNGVDSHTHTHTHTHTHNINRTPRSSEATNYGGGVPSPGLGVSLHTARDAGVVKASAFGAAGGVGPGAHINNNNQEDLASMARRPAKRHSRHLLRHFIKRYYMPLLATRGAQAVVLVAFSVSLVLVGVVGMARLELEFAQSDLLGQQSYVFPFLKDQVCVRARACAFLYGCG